MMVLVRAFTPLETGVQGLGEFWNPAPRGTGFRVSPE